MASQLGRNTKITFPDLGDAAGASQVNTQQNTIAELSNDDNSRYRTASGVIDGVTTTFDHDFGVDFSELSFLLYTGTHPNLVRVASPTASGWTIQANGTNPNEQVDVIAPSSGGPHTFALMILHTSGGTGGGSGTGEINYIENPDAEIDASSWNTFDDVSALVDGTGGSPTITFTAQDTVALRDSQSFKLAKDAADRRYEGVSADFAIAEQDQNKKLKIQFDFKTNEDAGYQSGWLKVAIYDIDNTQLITPVDTDIPRACNIFQTSFNSTNSTNYRLIIWIDTADAATAWDAYIDNVIVGPGMTSQGAAIGAWTSFAPSYIGLSSGSTEYAYKRRIGDSMQIKIRIENGSGTGAFGLNIPDGLSTTEPEMVSGALSDVNENTFWGAYSQSLTQIRFYAGSTPKQNLSSDTLMIDLHFPISQWAGKGIVPMLAEDNINEWQSFDGFVNDRTGTATVTYTSRVCHYRRVGDSAEVTGDILINTISGASTPVVGLPSGLNIDSTKIEAFALTGTGTFSDSSAVTTFSIAFAPDYNTGRTNEMFVRSVDGSTIPALGAGDQIRFSFKVPIAEWSGSQNSLVGYAEGSGDNLGLLKKNKWQRKVLSAHINSASGAGNTGTATDLTFNNLDINKLYKVDMTVQIDMDSPSGSTEFILLKAVNNSAEIARAFWQYDATTTDRVQNTSTISFTFQPTATSLTFDYTLIHTTSGCSIRQYENPVTTYGRGTFVDLMELNNTEETDEF